MFRYIYFYIMAFLVINFCDIRISAWIQICVDYTHSNNIFKLPLDFLLLNNIYKAS